MAVTEAGVTIEKAVRTDGSGQLAVALHVVPDADRPVAVRFEDGLPAEGRLAIDGSATEDESAPIEGGSIDGIVTVPAGSSATLAYRLDSDRSPDDSGPLPAPRIAAVLGRPSTDPARPSLRWLSPDGRRVPLAVRSDGSNGPDGTPETYRIEGMSTPAADGGTIARSAGVRPGQRDAPAIGIIARSRDADAIYRTILETRCQGLRTFLAPIGPGTAELAEIADDLGVTVVDPGSDDWLDARAALAARARSAGHPGIVLQPEGCPPIDYPRTLEAFSEGGFEIYAIGRRSEPASEAPRVLVGIPAYNAEGAIAEVVRGASAFADEVLVVDDGSADGTADRAREAGATVVVHERNRGYGGALKTIFAEAHDREAAHLVTIDADGQHDPAEIPRLVAAQEETGTGVVIASRYVADARTEIPFVRSIGLGVVNLLTNLSLGRVRPSGWVRDTQSGFRAYTAPAVASIHGGWDIGEGMWASTDILYQASVDGFDFHEIGTAIAYDVEHGSSESALTHGTGLVHNIAGILERAHPIALLALPGLAAVVVGAVLSQWALRLPADGLLFLVVAIATVATAIGGVMIVLAILFHVLNTHPMFLRGR